MKKRGLVCLALLLPFLPQALVSQVHYFENGCPWNQKAGSGPDSEVNGWFYNLGITGIRAELIAKESMEQQTVWHTATHTHNI